MSGPQKSVSCGKSWDCVCYYKPNYKWTSGVRCGAEPRAAHRGRLTRAAQDFHCKGIVMATPRALYAIPLVVRARRPRRAPAD